MRKSVSNLLVAAALVALPLLAHADGSDGRVCGLPDGRACGSDAHVKGSDAHADGSDGRVCGLGGHDVGPDGSADADTVFTQEVEPSRYDLRVHRYRRHWGALIPTQLILQNAGNMGYLSMGIGWDYGRRRQWETHLLVGFIPKYSSSRAKVTTTLKETYTPFSIYVGRGFAVEPLSTGLYVNTVYGGEFWGRQPGRYPVKYYEALSTKFRVNAFLGQRVTMRVPNNRRLFVKSVSAFYELSVCDLYVRAMFQDSSVSLWDVLALSLGLKVQLL